MFVEIFHCMQGDLKYIHMLEIDMFTNITTNISSKYEALDYLIEKNSIFLFRKNRFISQYPNTYICTFISKNLSLRNIIFIQHEQQYYKITKKNLEKLTIEKLGEYCEHQFPFATTFKHLVRRIMNI